MNENRTLFYFAYGSNMDPTQMSQRCPGSILLGIGRLNNCQFVINSRGVATVVPHSSKEVYGILWRIDELEEKTLDENEGIKGNFYKKRTMDVIDATLGKPVSALIYVASDSTPGRPRENYIERIIASAQEHGLPAPYIEELKSWLHIDGLRLF